MEKFVTLALGTCLIGLPFFSGCDSPVAPETVGMSGVPTQSQLTGEPALITVQHILIGFATPQEGEQGVTSSVPGKPITRTEQEAEELANELLKRATDGEDFGELVKEYTDDSAPGIYEMANFGETDVAPGVFKRDKMVAAFGNVGFPLPVGGVGLAVYDPKTSPYGWHIIKRIK